MENQRSYRQGRWRSSWRSATHSLSAAFRCALLLLLLTACGGERALSQSGDAGATRRQLVISPSPSLAGQGSVRLRLTGFRLPAGQCDVIVRVFLSASPRFRATTDAPAYAGSFTFGHQCNEDTEVDVTAQAEDALRQSPTAGKWYVLVQLADLRGKPVIRPGALEKLNAVIVR